MFEPGSRYSNLEDATLIVKNADGTQRTLTYKERRILPPLPEGAESAEGSTEHTVDDEERLDRITARYLGDPTLFWQICDRNGGLHPSELTAAPGRRLLVNGKGR
jgi:hypothetical protein